MALIVQDYLPVVVLVLILLSIRPSQPSIRNFVAVVLGTATAWAITPTGSSWGTAVCAVLLVLAFVMSPLASPSIAILRLLGRKIWPVEKGDDASGAMQPTRTTRNPDPIDVLHDPTDAEVDVVAVHGLGSSVERTWTHEESGRLWLKDLLPMDLPTARIMTFRHNTKWKSEALVKNLPGYGKQLLSALGARRSTDETRLRPLVFVGHSFGGLLIEQALVIAKRPVPDANIKKQYENLTSSLAGVIFLGTPHAGSSYSALGKLYCLLHYWQGASSLLFGYLDPGSSETRTLEDEFSSGYASDVVPTMDYYETRPNMILGMRVQMVVTEHAATRAGRPSEPLDTDHFGLNKYESQDDASYIAVKSKIAEMMTAKRKKMEKETEKTDSSHQKLLRSLQPHNFDSDMAQRQRTRTPGTCEWIVREREFQQWGREKNVLWIFGNPGSGKTYIAHYICQYLESEGHAVLHFFFDEKRADFKDLRSLKKFYQTILHQLLRRVDRVHPRLRAKCFDAARQRTIRDQDDASLFGALQDVLEELKMIGPVFLVVDALDECRDTEEDVLKDWLKSIASIPQLRIVITSRSLQNTNSLSDGPRYAHIHLHNAIAKSNGDIKLYIEDRIKKTQALPKAIPRVVEELRKKSNGMILYARLMLDILEDKAGDEDDLLREMQKLPSKLSELYANRLGQIKDEEFGKKILQWLVTCKRPLTVDGLQGVDTINRAIAKTNQYEFDSKTPPRGLEKERFRHFLLKECLPLVEVLGDDTVRLVHTTVAQFLKGEVVEKKGTPCPVEFLVKPVDSHEFVAVTCVTFLRWSFKAHDEENKPDFLCCDDLREYAVVEWPDHCEKSEEQILLSEKKEVFISFFRKEGTFEAWLVARARLDSLFRVNFGLDGKSIRPGPLHITAYFRLLGLGRLFLKDSDVNAVDATGSTALHIAAGNDNRLMIRDLLGHSARMDIADINGSYPLHRAVRRGNSEALVELLKNHQADVNVCDKFKLTPMHIACQLGRIKCVQILLDYGADIHNSSNAMEAPIGLAIANGHSSLVRMLLERGSLIEHCGRPLIQAARRGSSDTVRFLCDHGVDVSYTDLLGQNALHKACISQNKGLVEYLLSKGVDVDAQDHSKRTPLYFAAERGYLDIVNCLIEHGADVNLLDRRDETPLFKPAGHGHVRVVDRLLTAGTDATKLDMWKRTPLRFAAMKGRYEIVRMLLERTKIDQNLPDWAGKSVLHNAAAYLREGQEGVVDLLIQHNARPDQEMSNERGGTALHAAIFRVSGEPRPPKALIERLIQNKVPLNALDKYGKSALFYATLTRNLDAVRLLLESGALLDDDSFHTAVRTGMKPLVELFLDGKSKPDLAERDGWGGGTALHTAAAQGYDEIIQLLLEAGAPTRCLDRNIMTPLMVAEKEGRAGAVIRLLRIADPAPEGDYASRVATKMWGRSILHWAAESGGHLEKYITEHSHALNSQDDLGRTPLHLAVLSGSPNAVRQLLSAHPNTGLTDDATQTPLHYAAMGGSTAIVDALLKASTEVDPTDKWSRTPLSHAAEYGHSDAVGLLLAADTGLWDNYAGHATEALRVAALGGHARTVRILLDNNAEMGVEAMVSSKDGQGKTLLHLASENGMDEVVADILARVNEPAVIDAKDGSGLTPLHLASKKGHTGVVRHLIAAGSVVYRTDNDRNMAIHMAAEAGHLDIVEALLDALPESVRLCLETWDGHLPNWATDEEGADNAFLETLANIGALVNHHGRGWEVEQTEWTTENRQLLQRRIVSGLQTWDKEEHSVVSTTLMRAVIGGHADVVKCLLQRIPEMPLQAKHYAYSDALSLAASKGLAEVVRLLIKAGSAVNAITDSQRTCLHEAAGHGHGEVIEVLLQHDANPDLARYSDGYTALHLAAERGHVRAVRELLRVAYPDAPDDLGRTPLHLACLGGHDQVVDLLLDADADVFIEDFEKKKPMEVVDKLGENTKARMEEQALKQKMRRAAGN